MTPCFKVKSIAIIGAGPGGLATAKYLLSEAAFDKITIYEQRETTGGVWNYTSETPQDAEIIPNTYPTGKTQEPLWQHTEDGTRRAVYPTPMYDGLETNIPKSLMAFGDAPFPPDTPLFPSREVVEQYLEQYSQELQHLIRFSTLVLDVRLDDGLKRWSLKSRGIYDGCEAMELYDAVVVASGHYDVPYIPAIPGLDEWNHTHPGHVLHSRSFRTATAFKDKKVLVIGHAASGLDIAGHLAPFCRSPLLVSQRTESYLAAGSTDPQIHILPEISSFVPETRGVIFNTGHTEDNIDAVVFCTGYFYSYPFLPSLKPPPVITGSRVEHTYQHLLYHEPTLAFIGLPQRVTPFPIAEVQAAVIARLWSNRLEVPSRAIMDKWEVDRIAEYGVGKEFHYLSPSPEDGRYLNAMHDWAMQAAEKQGKTPPRWDKEAFWLRERFPRMKIAYRARGKERLNITSPEELGFDYDEWLREEESWEKPIS